MAAATDQRERSVAAASYLDLESGALLPMSKVEFQVEGEPRSKARHKTAVRGGKVVHYRDQATTDGQALIAARHREASGPYQVNDRDGFTVSMEFYAASRQRRDVDNMVKLVLDGLTGVAWKDDSQVTEIHAKVIHASEVAYSHVIVETNRDLPDLSTRNCANCGEPFRMYPSWSSTKKYCSRECGTKARNLAKMRKCQHCTKDYVTHSNAHDQKYCSPSCAQKARTFLATCAECQRQWRKPRSLNRSGRDFCGKLCHAEFWRKQRAKGAQGSCVACGQPKSRKEYRRCNACRIAGVVVPDIAASPV